MLILAIDTSAAASVALVDGDRVRAERTEFAARRHVEFIGPALVEVLANAPRPDAVVVGIGPGPFTGLRAGIAAGIGAALGAGVPVHGVVSHDALALRALTTAAEVPVAVATDARRREVYATVYRGLDDDGLPAVATGPAPLDPAALAAALHGTEGTGPSGGTEPGGETGPGGDRLGDGGRVRRVGRGFMLYADVLGEPEDMAPAALDPTAEWLARCAHRALSCGRELPGTEPLYLRDPDAKPSARRTTRLT